VNCRNSCDAALAHRHARWPVRRAGLAWVAVALVVLLRAQVSAAIGTMVRRARRVIGLSAAVVAGRMVRHEVIGPFDVKVTAQNEVIGAGRSQTRTSPYEVTKCDSR
jgi:hypothetical protein